MPFPESQVPFRRLLVAALVLVGPTVLALDILVFLNIASFNAAVLISLAAITGAVSVVWFFLFDLTRALKYIVHLNDSVDINEPQMQLTRSGVARELAVSAARLDHKWRRRVFSLARMVNISEEIQEKLDFPLFLLDGEKRIIRANAAARSLLGQRIINRDLAGLLRVPPVLEALQHTIQHREARQIEFGLLGITDRIFVAHITPCGDPSIDQPAAEAGLYRPIAALLTLQDITALRKSEMAQRDFVANVSHELRTPLAALIGFIETVRGPAQDDVSARNHFLGIMHDQAARMTRLVNDLLKLSKIELAEHSQPNDPVNVEQLIGQAISNTGFKAQHHGITLRPMPEPSLPAIRGDSDQLLQVLQNLIENAIKYAGDHHDIDISARLVDQIDQSMVEIAVRDYGPGIPREHLHRLTERFYRVAKGKADGVGLGLSIVQHIVRRHRGTLNIDSEIGFGSRFSVLLPIYK